MNYNTQKTPNIQFTNISISKKKLKLDKSILGFANSHRKSQDTPITFSKGWKFIYLQRFFVKLSDVPIEHYITNGSKVKNGFSFTVGLLLIEYSVDSEYCHQYFQQAKTKFAWQRVIVLGVGVPYIGGLLRGLTF